MKGNLLITGFEPFDGFTVNPSAEVAKSINGKSLGRFRIIGEVLELDYCNAMAHLTGLITEYKPEVVLLCGQAERPSISIERIGINAISTKRSDNYDNRPCSDIIEEGAPAAYFSNIDPHPLVEALTDNGIPAYLSYHAGIYGCNWILYNLLRQIDLGHVNLATTFIHLPPLPSQALEKKEYSIATMEFDTIVKAMKIIIEKLSRM